MPIFNLIFIFFLFLRILIFFTVIFFISLTESHSASVIFLRIFESIMHKMNRILISTLFLLFLHSILLSNNNLKFKHQIINDDFRQNIKFDHLTIEHGLSNNRIRCILQDKLGYIWIGTYDGLNRYDGYEFKIYRNDPADSTSLTSNWITALFEDSTGDLWISTMGGGLNKFDREKERFIPFSENVYKQLMWQGQSAITMKQIAEYRYKNRRVLWIGSWIGLLKLDFASGKIIHYPHTDSTAPDSHIQSVVVDTSGTYEKFRPT